MILILTALWGGLGAVWWQLDRERRGAQLGLDSDLVELTLFVLPFMACVVLGPTLWVLQPQPSRGPR